MSKSLYHFPNFEFLASAGKIKGITPFFKFGENPDIDTATDPEDVHSLGGDKLFPTAASTISVASTDANDTDGGSGAHNLYISGLDANYDYLLEEVRLNGTTPVVTSGSFLRVDRMYVTEGADAIGTITATHSEGAIAAISAGESQSLIACYSVPRNHILLLNSFTAAIINKQSAASVEAHFEIRFFGQDTFRVQQNIALIAQGTSGRTRSADDIWFPVPEKSDIRIRAHSVTSNDTGVVAAFNGYLINNSTFSW